MNFKNKLSRRDFLRIAGAGAAAASTAHLPFFNQLAVLAQAANITYMHHLTSENDFRGGDQVKAMFEEAYPGIRVDMQGIPVADYVTRFTAGILAGDRPDTAMAHILRFPEMHAVGGLLPLTDRINNWEKKQFISDAMWNAVTRDGDIFAVPMVSFVDWQYYRADWFAEKELEVPQTLDDFVAVAKALTDPENNRYGFGMRGAEGGQYQLIRVIESFGSPLVSADGSVVFERDAVIDGLRWFSELYTVHGVCPPSTPADSFQQIISGFQTGQTAMTWHHTGSLTGMSDVFVPGEQLGTSLNPVGPAGNMNWLGVIYNGMSSDVNADAAWAWLSYWLEPDATIQFFETTGFFPATSEVASDERITGNPLNAPALEALGNGRLQPNFVGFDAWARNSVLPEFQNVLVGATTVEDAADEMIRGLEETLS